MIGQTSPVLFALADKKKPIVCILHSSIKYAGEFVVEYHHSGEVVAFVGELTERKETIPVLIQRGNLKTPQKETMVPKDNTYMWKYYEYPKNRYTFLTLED